jgi:hypothetical protein
MNPEFFRKYADLITEAEYNGTGRLILKVTKDNTERVRMDSSNKIIRFYDIDLDVYRNKQLIGTVNFSGSDIGTKKITGNIDNKLVNIDASSYILTRPSHIANIIEKHSNGV